MCTEIITPDLPSSTAWLFPEYRFNQMNSGDYVNVIVERILGRGSWAQIRWLFDRYDRPIIAQWVQRHGYRRLDKRAFHYWRWMLGITEYRKPPWEQQHEQ